MSRTRQCNGIFLRLIHTVRFFVNATVIKKWVVWMLMILFIWCNCDYHSRICVCDIVHEWVPYPFCGIAMCYSYKRYESQSHHGNSFTKSHLKKSQLHSHKIAPCERGLKVYKRIARSAKCSVRCRNDCNQWKFCSLCRDVMLTQRLLIIIGIIMAVTEPK